MKRILLTNDDGVYSTGIRAAYKSVSDLGDVTVVAPSVQKSGVGRGISIFEPLRISLANMDGIRAYAVGGTPTDAVILGIFAVMKKMPDLVLSGFNVGENVSTDTVTTSGTIGAALEAASYGIPALAASIQVLDEGEKFDDPRNYTYNFDTGIKIVNRIARNVIKHGLPPGVDLLNINIPRHATVDTEIEITRLARKIFVTDVEERHDPRGRPYYWISGELIRDAEEGTDVRAVMKKGHISITPLSLDSTARVDFKEINALL
ncbi:5'-nucleotidase [Candidatus Methanoperedens nitroreducens]|uniref:5'-nucleotidase SurE n=1 Tax=Candidatus Methanoperedens nitratireducens TaxID=1392998 RepID=A0A062VD12_9EURY|nr:5'/3'-nucleotidase SurE [Candidatus Methanoperedens nitroreducens]KCZ73145.1 5'-nucleotidase [Candidatus Methanoperedens nitroreducens]MDJ1422905.1 5'/3'-nucleotidase SurE [Candidatus Methanoperedens sp.]